MENIITLKAGSVSLKGNKMEVNGKSFNLPKNLVKASKEQDYETFRTLALEFIQNMYKEFKVKSIKRKAWIRKALLNKYNQELVYRVDSKIKPKKVKKVVTAKKRITVPKKKKELAVA